MFWSTSNKLSHTLENDPESSILIKPEKRIDDLRNFWITETPWKLIFQNLPEGMEGGHSIKQVQDHISIVECSISVSNQI